MCPIGVHGDVLVSFQIDGAIELIEPSTGARLPLVEPFLQSQWWRDDLLLAETSLYAFVRRQQLDRDITLARIDPVTRAPLWTRMLAPEVNYTEFHALLLADESVLLLGHNRGSVAASEIPPAARVSRVLASGETAFACDLDANPFSVAAPVVVKQQLIVANFDGGPLKARVAAYPVPGIHLAERGWIMAGCNPQRTGRPR